MKTTDLHVSGIGTSVILLYAQTPKGREWAKRYLQPGDYNPSWPKLTIIEPRYIAPILQGAKISGLTIGGEG